MFTLLYERDHFSCFRLSGVACPLSLLRELYRGRILLTGLDIKWMLLVSAVVQ